MGRRRKRHGGSRVVRCVARVAALLLAPGLAFAQDDNRVASGRFDVAADVDAWAPSHAGATRTWASGEDADFCVDSGAARAVTTLEDSDVFLGACVPSGLAGSTSYRLAAAFRFASETVVGRAQVEVTFFDGPSCTGPALGGFAAPEPQFFQPGWQRAAAVGASPAGTESAQVRIALLKDSPLDPELVVFFDEVFLGRGDYLFTEDHEIESFCRWTLATVFN